MVSPKREVRHPIAMSRPVNKAAIAKSMASAESRFPRRAVAGELSIFMPKINRMAENMYVKFMIVSTFTF